MMQRLRDSAPSRMEVVEPRDGKLKRRSTRAGGATSEECCSLRWKRPRVAAASVAVTKEMKGAPAAAAAAGGDGGVDYFDHLPDDLVVCILCKLSSSSTCPSDLISALSTCKRFSVLGLNQMVLAKACARALAVKAKNWSESAHRFLKRCVEAGNLEACFILGMIRFYCLENRGGGASLMAKAAIRSHPAALYSLAIIQFNGSGGTKNDKDLRAGVALCARAAYLGYIDALRELGHCLQDGYGVRRNVAEGRRFLVQANARELASVLPSAVAAAASWPAWHKNHRRSTTALECAAAPPAEAAASGQQAHSSGCCPLLSDYGWSLPAPELHPANQFLAEWFAERGGTEALPEGLRLCSHGGCGRPETRRHEFRRCSVCGAVNYCSRACQALDWKLFHKAKCAPMDPWPLEEGAAAAAAAAGGGAPAVDGDQDMQ